MEIDVLLSSWSYLTIAERPPTNSSTVVIWSLIDLTLGFLSAQQAFRVEPPIDDFLLPYAEDERFLALSLEVVSFYMVASVLWDT